MSNPIITLTTDFGPGSSYVAEMKGVILSINPEVSLIDITHNVPAQDIRQGAQTLATASVRFPAESIHIGVVDPGVGSARALLYARIGNQHYIAPDNGLLHRLAEHQTPDRMVALTNRDYWLPDVSATFHGRDIMAPVAAHLSLGVAPILFGDPIQEWVGLEVPEVAIVPGKITGSIASIDSFGNLITDITAAMLEEVPRDESVAVVCDEHETHGIFQTYSDQPAVTLIALLGSSGQLEIAIVDESAQLMLGVAVGTEVTVTW